MRLQNPLTAGRCFSAAASVDYGMHSDKNGGTLITIHAAIRPSICSSKKINY